MFRLTPSSGQDKIKFHYLLTLCEFQIIISIKIDTRTALHQFFFNVFVLIDGRA
jgi:hypothetical protein